jgi:hypothetical protein
MKTYFSNLILEQNTIEIEAEEIARERNSQSFRDNSYINFWINQNSGFCKFQTFTKNFLFVFSFNQNFLTILKTRLAFPFQKFFERSQIETRFSIVEHFYYF